MAPPALAQSAAAQDGPLILRMGRTLTLDSNVLRVLDTVPDPQLARGITGQSDRVATTYVGLRFDKDYSQQHFRVDATETAVRYGKFTFLDRNARDWRAAWDWHLTQRLSGTISADSKQSIVGFDDTTEQKLIVTVATSRNLSLDAWLFGGWHLAGNPVLGVMDRPLRTYSSRRRARCWS